MSQAPGNVEEVDFASQMRSLAAEAQQHIEDRAIRRAYPSLLQMLRPMVLGLEALTRATAENTTAITKLESAAAPQKALPALIGDMRDTLESRNAVSQQLFDSLHQELRSYRDGFLLDVLHKPLIRDLIGLFDDLNELRRQIEEAVTASEGARTSNAQLRNGINTVKANLENSIEFLLEILARMNVAKIDPEAGKLNKATQRAVAVENAESPEDDGDIVHSVRPGFSWQNRMFRPEEVIIKKWKEGALIALTPSQS